MERTLLLIILIIFLVFSAVLVQTGWLRDSGAPLDVDSFFFGGAVIASIGFVAFRFVVWQGNTRAFFLMRPAALHPGHSSFQMLWDAIISVGSMLGVLAAAILAALWHFNRLDLAVQFLGWVTSKGERLMNALLH
ncbi:MAG: hypothetical protein A2Z03_05070 [Chloroflexi bacterium RBG_16_56_8]|nr:MAG: hypothetical protein A2Z03_05070 [Chloroflexi bacterium RBG_16_56_8]